MDKETTNVASSKETQNVAPTTKEGSYTQPSVKTPVVGDSTRPSFFHPRFMSSLADEVAKLVIKRLPRFAADNQKKKQKPHPRNKQTLGAFFLDTSAIIDGRIFDVMKLGLLGGIVVVPAAILLELKHIADSKDPIKKERGRKGLEGLESVKKLKTMKLLVLSDDKEIKAKHKEVDEQLIAITKQNKGKVITCDYNLEKKAFISGVTAINVHELANRLKILAIPGEEMSITLQHIGKDPTQGVGYLDDGTMVVVEQASTLIGQTVHVMISRVIQTSSGKILFSKKV